VVGQEALPNIPTCGRFFGSAVDEIRNAFLHLDKEPLDALLSDYGAAYGHSAEQYARSTFSKWLLGTTTLSGQTMERLIELVPPYLSADQRYRLLQYVLATHKKSGTSITIRINITEPTSGFSQLGEALGSMSHNDILAHLPERVLKAAQWLYDDDITTARAMIAEVERRENEMIRSNAFNETELLQQVISTKQIQTANYSVEMPAGKLNVVAYTPSKCFVATVCCGQDARETIILRHWRDTYLVERPWGRRFVVFYYTHGEALAEAISRWYFLKVITRICIIVSSTVIKSYGDMGGVNE
jgi:hypothetical protein